MLPTESRSNGGVGQRLQLLSGRQLLPKLMETTAGGETVALGNACGPL